MLKWSRWGIDPTSETVCEVRCVSGCVGHAAGEVPDFRMFCILNNFLLKFNFYEKIPEDKIVTDKFFLDDSLNITLFRTFSSYKAVKTY
jgi:hypothetical protein